MPFFIKNSFVFLCGQLLQRCSQFRLNRLRSAIRYVSQAHFLKSGVQQVQLLKKKKESGSCSQRGADSGCESGNESGGPRSADSGFSGFSPGSGGNSSRAFSLPVFTLVLLLLPFPCCREFLSPLFPEAQQPVCSRAQHWIRSQQLPLKLRCIITTSCSCSGRLAGRLCKQAS